MNVTNTGNEIIGNLEDMDFYIVNPAEEPGYYTFSETTSEIMLPDGSPESIHLNQLDPGEVMRIQISGASAAIGTEVVVVTSNGVSGSAFIT